MRFDSLNIPAYGPFSDFTLRFPASKYDIHLIYGANEAGKSSLLRAINGLFFGIPARTTDHFIHANAKLLIGAKISEGSESLTFFRKKGTKNTLLDESQGTLDESTLGGFLGSVNEEFFQHMFGLNTESLRAGAARLLSGEGDLGTAIFSASLGGSPIDDAIKKLEAEAGTLCRGASKKDTTILPAVAAFKEAERAAKSELITANAWRFLEAEVESGKRNFSEKDQRYRDHRRRWQFVEACLNALPVLKTVRELERELQEIEAPELPLDFPKRVRDAESELARSQHAHALLQSQIQRTTAALEKGGDFEKIIESAADFEELRRKAESYLENLEALPALESFLTERDLEKLPAVGAALQARFREVAESLFELTRKSQDVAGELSRLEIELKNQQAELTDSLDLSGLEEQCQRADAFAVERGVMPQWDKELAALRAEEKRQLARLQIKGEARVLKVPGVKSIQAALKEQERLAEVVRETEARLREVGESLAEEQAGLAHLASQAVIYSEADLAGVRKDRDAFWAKMVASKMVDELLGEKILKADQVADSLRDHADQIAVAAGYQARIAQWEGKRDRLGSDLTAAKALLQTWLADWNRNSPDRMPLELLEWREEWESLCEVITKAEELEGGLGSLRQKESRLLQDLGGEDFEQVHRKLKATLNAANQKQGEQQALRKSVARNEVKFEQLSHEAMTLAGRLTKARGDWEQVCAETEIPAESSPRVAIEALDERVKARERLVDYQARRLVVERYETLLKEVGERFQGEASEPVLLGLYDKARFEESRAQTLREELDQLRSQLPGVKLALEKSQSVWQALIGQAGSGELEAVIVEIEKRRGLTTRLQEQRGVLQGFASTRDLGEFVTELEEQDGSRLSEEKVALEQAEEQLQRERDEAKADFDEQLRRRQELMKASDLAASHKQAAADALATIVADTTRFRQLHYAIDFLKQQVEDYRKKTQGPMIEKTTFFFRALTGGRFERVSAQLDDKGHPQLAAIRAGGESLATTGLSEGTADQLYLALRLAAIELHLGNHSAMPLVLDDLLMTFDDDRTKALFEVLTTLSQKTQILIFTHHAHLKALAGSEVQVHDLAG